MSKPGLSFKATLFVRDACLCFQVQRAARTLARRFDKALRPLEMTNGQFTLLMSLNRPQPPSIGSLALLLAMDRTTLTAALKPLQRRGLVKTTADRTDKRGRRIGLTAAGRSLLRRALPIWRRTHAQLEQRLGGAAVGRLRRDLGVLAQQILR